MNDIKELRRLVIELRKCTCHEGYTSRKLHDPNCQFHSGYHDDAANAIESLLDKIDELVSALQMAKDVIEFDGTQRQFEKITKVLESVRVKP